MLQSRFTVAGEMSSATRFPQPTSRRKIAVSTIFPCCASRRESLVSALVQLHYVDVLTLGQIKAFVQFNLVLRPSFCGSAAAGIVDEDLSHQSRRQWLRNGLG